MKERNQKSLIIIACIIGFLLLVITVVSVSISSKSANISKGQANQSSQDVALGYGKSLSGAEANEIQQRFNKKLIELKKQSTQRLKVLQEQMSQLSKKGDESKTSKALQEQLAQTTKMYQEQINALKKEMRELKVPHTKDGYDSVKVGGNTSKQNGRATIHSVTWINSSKFNTQGQEGAASGQNNILNPNQDQFNLFPSAADDNDVQENSKVVSNFQLGKEKDKPKPIPFYTIPINTVLTGVIPLQPLIGRIPRGQGQVYQPFRFLFMIEHPNLSANGHQMPIKIKTMMGSALCVGDFLSESTTCGVQNYTFIFDDGRIQTVETKSKDGGVNIGNALGSVTDEYGNPQIRGQLKTAIGLRLAMTGAMTGVQAYGQGLAQAQIENFGQNAISAFQRVKNTNDYALGQAVSGIGSGANEEWKDISKNMYDYVFVPNWNPNTKRLIRLNIVTNKQINIDYDPNGRKVNYDRAIEKNQHNFVL